MWCAPSKTIVNSKRKPNSTCKTSIWIHEIMLHFILLCLFCLLLPQGNYGLQCYQCGDSKSDYECMVGLLGDKVNCSSTTTSCYKSWTVESSPRTKRKCADDKEYDDACHDVIFGQMSMLACYCQEDFCNSATLVSKTDITKTVFITMLSLLIFAH